MRTGFFMGLAKDGIRKNKRLYLPYLLACVTMITMYFIMVSLQYQKSLQFVRGGSTLAIVLGLGSWVIAIFSVIFLFYTNTFLMRRRKKEFGLYHILGMGKRHICRILFWENLFMAAISLAGGIICGLLLSKLAELGLLNMIRVNVNYDFYLTPQAFIMTIVIYGVLFALLYFNAVRQIVFTNTVALLASEKTGEKPPKANWFLGFSGVAMLVAAYVICFKIESPISALSVFFVAVILVILGTYLVFIASSVVLCKILQKHKKYYYQTRHFVSVSSMMYRMKRTGAGLASICILATMVLVMLSSTACLYFGAEDVIHRRYPREVNMGFQCKTTDIFGSTVYEDLSERIYQAAENAGGTVTDAVAFPYTAVFGLLQDGYLKVNADMAGMLDTDMDSIVGVYLFPIAVYNQYAEDDIVLDDDEALMYCTQKQYKGDTIELEEAGTIHIVKTVHRMPTVLNNTMDVVPIISLYVNDIEKTLGDLANVRPSNMDGEKLATFSFSCVFDNGLSKEEQADFAAKFLVELERLSVVGNQTSSLYDAEGCNIEYRELERGGYFELMGGMFYLGIILCIVFLFATVLIIYYKQISEGFEDEARFEIMQKVGMTKKEIRQSINSQMLTVFFFPLILAGIHIIFAFPIIRKLLMLFLLNNVTLFAITCLFSFLIFAIIYMLIYKCTSNAYLKIVSGADNK